MKIKHSFAIATIGLASFAISALGAELSAKASALPEELRQGLILYYSFDNEPSATDITDESDEGNNGSPVNVEWVKDGHQGGAASFGPTDSYITVPNKTKLNPPVLTLSAWIKTSCKDAAWRRIFDKGSTEGYTLTMGGGPVEKNWQGEVCVEAGKSFVFSGIQVTDGTWHHIAGTFDGEESKIYVDGMIAQTKRWKGEAGRTSYNLTIGSNLSRPAKEFGPSFNGTMDDVMMFNRALSADEVQALFKSQGGATANYIADQYLANEIESKQLQLAGKIVKVKFNRIEYVRKSGDGVYTGILLSFVKPKGSTYYSGPGVVVKFPQEGLGFFKNIMTPVGVDDFISEMTKPDREEVYIQVGSDARSGSVAAGDQYKKDGDEREYRWSEKTEIPDLASQQKVSVRDAVIFPEQLNGKTVVIEFYTVTQIKPKSDAEYNAYISSGRGDASVQITFPAAGLAFFKEIDAQESRAKVYSVYAKVNVSLKGIVTFEAKGRRVSGSGDEIEYRW